jgi:pyruvate/oxaloacetate carboxyltransferase
MHILEQEFDKIVAEKSLTLADNKIDDLLTYALFPQVGINFSVGVAGATTSAADFIEVTLPPADTSTL